MRIWLIYGLSLVFFSIVLEELIRFPELLVYFNFVIGCICLLIVFYINYVTPWFYLFNELRSRHEGAEYQNKQLIQKLLLFGLPNVIVGGIYNEIYSVWPWTSEN